MCAHFIVIPQDELNRMITDIRNAIAAQKQGSIMSSYEHAYPKSQVPVLVDNNDSNGNLTVTQKTWGYPVVPARVSWQKEVLFNTKIETALGNKPSMWDDSINNRRCIVPTFGFFEPHMTDTHLSPRTGKLVKDNYFFHCPDSDAVWMAGVFEDDFFSVMTTNPNKWIKPIHRRMPLILRPYELSVWLRGDYSTLSNREDIELVANKVA